MVRRVVALTLGLLLLIGSIATPIFGLFPGYLPPEATTVDDPVLNGDAPALSDEYHGRPDTVIRIGQGTNGVPVTVWNNATESQSVRLVLVHELTGTTVLNRTETLPAGSAVQIDLLAKTTYRVVAIDRERGTRVSRTIERSRFDCNHHNVDVQLRPTGRFDVGAVMTSLGCPPHNEIGVPHWVV